MHLTKGMESISHWDFYSEYLTIVVRFDSYIIWVDFFFKQLEFMEANCFWPFSHFCAP